MALTPSAIPGLLLCSTMHTMIQQVNSRKMAAHSLLDIVLPVFISELQDGFTKFADCGAGIGWTAKHYSYLLRDNLRPEQYPHVQIVCYEPLEENFERMKLMLDTDQFVLRKLAVGDVNGVMKFSVPGRMSSDQGYWTSGTSFGGFLSDLPDYESVEVDVVRLDDDGHGPFDFIKFDLQGGEAAAITGASRLLGSAKMVYVEHQLLENRSPVARTLLDRALFPFFDQLQFGCFPGVSKVPLELLNDIGISLGKIEIGQGDMPTIMWGTFTKTPTLTDDLVFPEETIARLSEAGLHYVQTDLLAVAPPYMRLLSKALR
jgi:FkbM family methyltransferase